MTSAQPPSAQPPSTQAPSAAAIRLDRVEFVRGGTEFAFDIAFAPSSVTAIVGPSGAGKSTLLDLIAGFETPQRGRVLFADRDMTGVPPAGRPVSMVFQENNLFAHLTVEENVGLGRSPSLRLSPADRIDVAAALAGTGLAGKEKRLPRELSGGERQRVALSRTLLRDRPVLLLDEAFASLGPALRAEMLDLVLRIHEERRMAVLFVTHQPDDASRIAERIVFLEAGRVAAEGPSEGFFSGTAPEAFRRYVGGSRSR